MCRVEDHLTPMFEHLDGGADTDGQHEGDDENRHGAIDLFCENLRAYLDGAPLRNVIDWVRGY